ncbi:hypothetical protein BWI93_16100 [Siphonobacter sp. BAB-5385]|uniref:hypothetical protein n=1 Tax=Siphonobacter sp. BAB-5385 TaxID=1864822 RepID=UPI000B9EE3B6|nr:hypothetical protein [Siphonobacter sp. BAB-5385]OZI07190.1 hypothetical protein BWI93_16100 [Siphonobacter sp. BAB-5385]
MKITIDIPEDQAVFMKQLLDHFPFVTITETVEYRQPAGPTELVKAFPLLQQEAHVRVSNILKPHLN